MKKKIVTFGEIMMRLTTPGNLRLQQSRELSVNYGGSEANVAISVANFGGQVDYVTRLPENPLGEACIAEPAHITSVRITSSREESASVPTTWKRLRP